MQRLHFAIGVVAASMFASVVPSHATEQTPMTVDLSGLHDFDFQVGDWRVHHRVKRPTGEWLEFDGTCSNRPLMGGAANVEDNTFDKPSGVTRGVALRAYDSKTARWAI